MRLEICGEDKRDTKRLRLRNILNNAIIAGQKKIGEIFQMCGSEG